VGDLQIFISPKSTEGANLALSTDGTAILNAGGSLAAGGRDFVPGSRVDFFLLRGDAATFLGSLDVLGDGTYLGFVPIPVDLAGGTYALQVNGVTNNTRQRAVDTSPISISIRVKVVKPAAKLQAVRVVVYFEAFSAKLTEPSKRALNTFVKQPRNRSSHLVRIVGFVGPGGSVSHVKTLSKARAESVARYLRSKGIRGKYVLQSGGNSSGDGPLAWHADVLVIPNQGR